MIHPFRRTGPLSRKTAGMRTVLFFCLIGAFCAESVCRADTYQPWTPPAPLYEVYPDEPLGREPPPAAPEAPRTRPPKAALILDDVGYNPGIIRKFMALGIPITYAILPASPFAARLSEMIRKQGFEQMLHIPMEPEQYPAVNPGPGALMGSMAPADLLNVLTKSLDAFPMARGVNNHMGSRLTSLPAPMFRIMTLLKQRNLYFIDSRTASGSVCRTTAGVTRIPFGERDIFLDHELSAKAIRRQISGLLRAADAYGEAIGIAHPHGVTYRILREQLPVLKKKIEWVPASRIVHIVD